jgi:hypothetical protein
VVAQGVALAEVEVNFVPHSLIQPLLLTFFLTGRGGGRGGFQQRELGPPDQILGTLTTIFIFLSSFTVL